MHRGALFWGAGFVLIGGLLFLSNLGVISVSFGTIFWPAILILLGIGALLSIVSPPSSAKAEAVSIPLQGASKAVVRLRHGAGQLHIDSSADPGTVLSGTVGGGADPRVRMTAGYLEVDVRPAEDFGRWIWPWNWGISGALDWSLGLARDVPLELDLQTGASQTQMDLSDLRITDLRLRSGASSTHVTLPASGVSRVRIEAGAASLVIRIPDNVRGRIRTRGGLSDLLIDRQRFPRTAQGYQSPDFDTARDRVEIDVDMGVGSIKVI